MCTTRRPAASSACARASTSITSKGSISAARRAVSLSMTVRDYNFLVDEQLKKNALEYHRRKPAGKISVLPTKQLTNQRDLGLAYTPGVAAACEEIVRDPAQAFDMTSRANLIAVVTNGTAVLGLGAIGPLAAKPVMEGKSVLFKKFAGIDCFDIELDERDPDKLVDIIAALEPTFGGINLEDIKAPECFTIERKLRSRMKIPVFHDDQHGTAITVAAAIFNGLKVVGKRIEEVKLVPSGAGAAALACLDLLVKMGLPLASITVTDIKGVVYEGTREEMDPDKERYAKDTRARALDEAIAGADVFLGLSAGGVLKPSMVKKMAERPLILALANPEPEILPELAKAAKPDCVIATGRSDYPNQVNNVLRFPFLFRDAPDRRPRCLPRFDDAVRVPLRAADEAGVLRGESGAAARGVRRRRGRARAARGADRHRRRPGQADADRPSAGDRAAPRAAGPAGATGQGVRAGESGVRFALPRLLDHLPAARREKGRVARLRAHRDAAARHADRRDDDLQGRGRRHAVWHLRHARAAPALRRPGDRPAPRRAPLRGDECADPADAHGVHLRHLRHGRPGRRERRRDDLARRGGGQALRPDPQGGAAVGFQLRLGRPALGRQDAARAAAHYRARSPA